MEVSIIMRVLLGNTPWHNKFMAILVVLILLIGIQFGYCSYLEGTIHIDDELINDIERSRIDNEWDKLLEFGFHVDYFDENSKYFALLTYRPATTDDPIIDNMQIVIYSDWYDGDVGITVNADYNRVSLVKALLGMGSIGECTSQMTIETSDYLIYMVDYESDNTGYNFEVMLQKIVNAINT